MQRSLIATVIVLAWPALAEDPHAPPTAAPDPEFLVFLGETGGEDVELIFFMDTREAHKALKQAEQEDRKEDDHE